MQLFLQHSFWIPTKFLSSFWKSTLLRRLHLRHTFHFDTLSTNNINRARSHWNTLVKQELSCSFHGRCLFLELFSSPKKSNRIFGAFKNTCTKKGKERCSAKKVVHTHTIFQLTIFLETAVIWTPDKVGITVGDLAPCLQGEKFFPEILGAQYWTPWAGFSPMNAKKPLSYIEKGGSSLQMLSTVIMICT